MAPVSRLMWAGPSDAIKFIHSRTPNKVSFRNKYQTPSANLDADQTMGRRIDPVGEDKSILSMYHACSIGETPVTPAAGSVIASC
jgi:hypothetical protein